MSYMEKSSVQATFTNVCDVRLIDPTLDRLLLMQGTLKFICVHGSKSYGHAQY